MQIDIPFFAYILRDTYTLSNYDSGKVTPLSEIRRRLLDSSRSFNPYLPDYIYENRYRHENEVPDKSYIENLGSFITNGFVSLANKYLYKVNGNLYIQKEKLEEWMAVMQLCPPLLICAAYYLNDFRNRSSNSSFFRQVLIPQFSSSAMRIPYVFELDNWINDGKGLMDLHVHLNGTTETDMLWWSQIGQVDKWIASLRDSLVKERVRSQYEQLYIEQEQFIKQLRLALNIIKKLVRIINKDYKLFKNDWDYYIDNGNTPVLAKGAYFYLALFDKIQNEGNLNIACKFHHLILILGNLHKLLVQQKNQKGFTQFGVIPDNDLCWSHESKEYLKRLRQIISDNQFCFIDYLEGRFSPSSQSNDNLKIIKKINDDFEKLCKEISSNRKKVELSLIAHFIKKMDKNPYSHFERHSELRRKISQKSHSLLNVVQRIKHNKWDVQIKGIDAASNEMSAGPEVFSPAFRYMRNHWTGNEDLRITFHAGEDFVHLLSGLRMIVEAEEFLEMRQGDRIGHGTAAGISPALWMERVGDNVHISQGEWMDDLLVTYYLISSEYNPYISLKSLLTKLKDEIEDLAFKIYQKPTSITVLLDSWKCRMYDPRRYLLNDRTAEKDEQQKECVCRRLLSDYHVKDLYFQYHFNSLTKKRYNNMISVSIDKGIFSVEDFIHIQDLVLYKLARKGIALESPITSNLNISFYKELKEHHLERWLKGHSADGKIPMPAVVIGSDDLGIFMTNIFIEYARIMKYLEEKGYNITERMHKIEELSQISQYYRF